MSLLFNVGENIHEVYVLFVYLLQVSIHSIDVSNINEDLRAINKGKANGLRITAT